jgi:hypothetical protein
VRSGATRFAEDDKGTALDLEYFAAIAHGYLGIARDFLSSQEVNCLPVAGKIVAFELGMRFLTDYLLGDSYFKTKYAAHNLDRARHQFHLVEQMQKCESEMKSAIADR